MLKLKSIIHLLSLFLIMSFPMSLYAATTTTNNETPTQYIQSSTITTEVKTRLLADPDIKSLNISVKTENGTVILRGYVDTLSQMNKAVYITKKVDGVKAVVNHLKIKPQS